MTTAKGVRVAVVWLPLILAVADQEGAQAAEVIMLVSPNEDVDGAFGISVAGAGDVNQDGFADVVVGALDSPNVGGTGRGYVFSGRDGSLLLELASPHEQPGGGFGEAVAGAGDVNHDGFADLIIGASFESGDVFLSGRAYVFSGRDGSLLWELDSPNAESAGKFGLSVAGARDVDQDGFDDVLVGAPEEDPGTSPNDAGRAYVFSGRTGQLLFELVSPTESEFGYFGHSVAGVGSIDQDGFADVAVGAFLPGHIYVFSGQDGILLRDLADGGSVSVANAGDVNADDVPDVIGGSPFNPDRRAHVYSGQDGSELYELVSPNDETFGGFGTSVAGAGDLDQDAFSDLLVGAPGEDPGTSPSGAGRAYLFSGLDKALLLELVSPNEELGGIFGQSVAAAGDVNQDGLADLVVGAPGESPGSSPDGAGRAYVYLTAGGQRINSGGPNYTAIDGSLFIADRAYAPGSFGYVGGLARHFDRPIGDTDDDPLYQDVRVGRRGDSDGVFSYRFDVSPGRYDVTLYLMAPALDGPGNVVMDVKAEEDVVFDDLDVTGEAGGEYQALVKTFGVDVTDGTLDLRFRAVNKAAVVSAIAVAAQAEGRGATPVSRPSSGGE